MYFFLIADRKSCDKMPWANSEQVIIKANRKKQAYH
jgi:hypothetical protein